MRAVSWIALLVGLYALMSDNSLAQSQSIVERGRAIAAQHCARCHAIGMDDEPPHAIVTPFRELHVRYPIEMLVDTQATGVISGHDEMPMFELSHGDLNALLAYIDSFAPVGLRYLKP
jgi:mono/diheme cytochrome c family protein